MSQFLRLEDLTALAGYQPDELIGDLLVTGEEAIKPRWSASGSSGTLVSGTLYLTYWTARKTEPVANMAIKTSGSAAAATPTLIRTGVYAVSRDSWGLTLVSSSVNDTTKMAATNTEYTFPHGTGYSKVAGQRYASGLLIVSAAAMPTTLGLNAVSAFGISPRQPRLAATLAGQTDLPATITDASLSSALVIVQSIVLPA